MSRVSNATAVRGVAAAVSMAVLAGCQNDSSSTESGGRVISQTQHQDVTPEGTQIQTRTQVRETPSGQQIRETQMQTRENVTPERTESSTGAGTTGTGSQNP